MSKAYSRSNIERKAKELLAPIQVSCPDSLWQELNIQLNERSSKSNTGIKNGLYTPKVLAFALVGISLITFILWKFLPEMSNGALHKNSAIAPEPKKVVTPVVKADVPVNKPTPAPAVDTAAINRRAAFVRDSIKSLAEAAQLKNNNLVQNTNIKPVINPANALFGRRDTLSRRNRNANRLISSKDSTATRGNKRDSATKVYAKRERAVHDSIMSNNSGGPRDTVN